MRSGDVVRHRDGGPEMTVERAEDDVVFCAWFVGAALNRAAFSVDDLERLR